MQRSRKPSFLLEKRFRNDPFGVAAAKSDIGCQHVLFRALETFLTINVKVLAGRGEFESLDEFILRNERVLFTCLPSRRKILEAFTVEYKIRVGVHRRRHRLLIDKPFLVELPHDEAVARSIVTEDRPMFVNFALGVFLPRRQQLSQLIDRAAPARSVALDCVSAPEFFVPDNEFGAGAVRSDGEAGL